MDKYKLPEGRDAHILTHEGAEPMKAFTPQEVEEIEVALEERDAAIAALTPQFGDAIPTEPGWYWTRWKLKSGQWSQPRSVEVREIQGVLSIPGTGVRLRNRSMGGVTEWSGPITPPKATPPVGG